MDTALNYNFVKKTHLAEICTVTSSFKICSVSCTMYVFVSDTKFEFYMNDTVASNNTQHGVYLENIRNYVIVNSSSISYNGYGAGLCVYGGAGTNLCYCCYLIQRMSQIKMPQHENHDIYGGINVKKRSCILEILALKI